MSPAPKYVEIITWNDGPESHYIGNLWPEANTNPQGLTYAAPGAANHSGWQTLIAAFLTSYKNPAGSTKRYVPPATIAPPGLPYGALWYKAILQNASCPNDDGGTSFTPSFYEKPSGFDTGDDLLHYGVYIPLDATGWRVNLSSNGVVIGSVAAHPGFNFGNSTGIVRAGSQVMKVRGVYSL